MSGDVRSAVEELVATVVFENPAARNALSPAMLEALPETVGEVCGEGDVRVVLLRSGGDRAFSAGFDVTAFDDTPGEAAAAMVEEAAEAVRDCRVPVVGVVDGDAFGGAVGLLAACDLRVAAGRVRIGIPAARMGLVYGGRATARLVELVGPAHAKELLMTGEAVDAERAADMGFLNRVVPADDLDGVARALADRIASNAPLSVEGATEVVEAVAGTEALSAADRRRIDRLVEVAARSRDHAEGLAAFEEGREPEFEGR